MSKHFKLLPVFLLLLLAGCSAIYFDAPMPVNVKSQAEFNAAMTGTYHVRDSMISDKKDNLYNAFYYENNMPAKDSVVLFALDLMITKKTVSYVLKLSMCCKDCKDLDELMKKAASYKRTEKEKVKKYNRNDYTIYEKTYADTILNLSKKDKLKFYDGCWYLNNYVSDQKAWQIFQLRPDGKEQFSFAFTNFKDKEKLKNFIKKERAFSSLVHVSDAVFDRFVKQGGFSLKMKFEKYR